jgi:hypothetical protein
MLLPDLITGIQNTTFCQENGMQSARIHNKVWHSAPSEATLAQDAPRAEGSVGASSMSLLWIHEFQWAASPRVLNLFVTGLKHFMVTFFYWWIRRIFWHVWWISSHQLWLWICILIRKSGVNKQFVTLVCSFETHAAHPFNENVL